MVTKASLQRLYLVAAIGLCLWGVLGIRLGLIQIRQREHYLKRAENQQRRAVVLEPNRGKIFDRNLRVLAVNLNVDSFGVQALKTGTPEPVEQLHDFATRVGMFTKQNPDRLFVKLTSSPKYFWLARGVDLETSKNIQSIPVMKQLRKRMQIRREFDRAYPFGTVGGQLVGFTNIDGKGLAGVEMSHNAQLTGSQGFSLVQVDATGRQYSRINEDYRPPSDGTDLVLTIDTACQEVAENTLRETIEEHDAKGGMIVMMDPNTGEILAMASEPSYDPNHPGDFPIGSQKIRSIVDTYEPGSTFKLVTANAALDTKTFKESDMIFCNNGSISVGGRTIRDHEAFGALSVSEVIMHSSNVGTIKMALQLGDRKFYEYARAFGFGSLTGIDMPGEAKGMLWNPTTWSATSLPTMAIGYGVSVSALQVATAYSAVANGGMLMEPHMVKATIDPRNGIQPRKPVAVRRVMSPETAGRLRNIFKGVVENGTGRKAKILGYKVAGKTGTAWKARTDGRGYSKNYMSSFVGFFPADNPQVVALVVIDEPKSGYYGGDVSAPAFRKIMERIVSMPKGPVNAPPSQKGLYLAMLKANKTLIAASVPTEDASASDMLTLSDTDISRVMERVENRENQQIGNPVVLPSVVGLSLREAVNRLAGVGLEVRVVGSGRVVRQIPVSGTRTAEGELCLIECRPQGAMALSSAPGP